MQSTTIRIIRAIPIIRISRSFGVAVLVALVLASSGVAGGGKRRADLSRLVVVGDSLSAGFQNGSLLDRQQGHGFASLIAGQAGCGWICR